MDMHTTINVRLGNWLTVVTCLSMSKCVSQCVWMWLLVCVFLCVCVCVCLCVCVCVSACDRVSHLIPFLISCVNGWITAVKKRKKQGSYYTFPSSPYLWPHCQPITYPPKPPRCNGVSHSMNGRCALILTERVYYSAEGLATAVEREAGTVQSLTSWPRG